MYDGRSPAAAFCEVVASGLPYYIHFCDATAGWDWDLMAGSHQLWPWAEFLFQLRQAAYDGWLTADIFPVRQDATTLFAASIAFTECICRWLDALDRESAPISLDALHFASLLRGIE
jgi:sugar phosphate isomerase/epimerase